MHCSVGVAGPVIDADFTDQICVLTIMLAVNASLYSKQACEHGGLLQFKNSSSRGLTVEWCAAGRQGVFTSPGASGRLFSVFASILHTLAQKLSVIATSG